MPEPSLPESYYVQNGCHNCWWAYWACYDRDGNFGECTFGLPLPRPMSLEDFYHIMDSVILEFGVSVVDDLRKAVIADLNDWLGRNRSVSSCGKCNHYHHDSRN